VGAATSRSQTYERGFVIFAGVGGIVVVVVVVVFVVFVVFVVVADDDDDDLGWLNSKSRSVEGSHPIV
jgi:heme/copper-type cytochrome/quinol oxidase subunit 2